MKKILFVLLLNLPFLSEAYQWQPFTPDTVNALTVCFDAGWPYAVGTIKGLLINDGPSYSWVSYNYNLPVWDVIADPDSAGIFLLVMGDGSYSDGIYKFYTATHTYRVLEWVVNPTFIKFNSLNHSFFVGTRFNGMKTSVDGFHWTDIPFFAGKAATAIDMFNEHMAVIQENNLFATFYSNDTGRTWQQSSSVIPLHDVAYDRNGKLYGVFTGMSNSSGLYSSPDYGETWNREWWEMGMNVIGFDMAGNVVLGWHTPTVDFGIGIFDSIHQRINYLNSSLPCKNVHKIRINPVLSSITIFACTDSGVYFSNNYISELRTNESLSIITTKVYPNPSKKDGLINICFPERAGEGELTIFNLEGKQIMHMSCSFPNVSFNKEKLGEGLFFYKVRTGDKIFFGKFIIL